MFITKLYRYNYLLLLLLLLLYENIFIVLNFDVLTSYCEYSCLLYYSNL